MTDPVPALKQTAILIVNYHGENYLPELLGSLSKAIQNDQSVGILIVNNGPEDQDFSWVHELPAEIQILSLAENRGFTGGNNAGWKHIQHLWGQVPYLMLLNQDTVVDENFLNPLFARMQQADRPGAVQCRIMLYEHREQINTLGNRSHFLGFGWIQGFQHAYSPNEIPQWIDFPSGAAVLIRTESLKQEDLFFEPGFMYCEDVDLGWRLRSQGDVVVCEPDSLVYHHYDFQFHEALKHYHYFERNRLFVLLSHYRLATLVLLFPAFLLMEMAQLIYAGFIGKWNSRVSIYQELLSQEWRVYLKKHRRQIQSQRSVRDRDLLKNYAGSLPELILPKSLPAKVLNFVLYLYWCIVREFIFW